jgi:hypothetical protein
MGKHDGSPVKSLPSRNERLSRAPFLPIFLDKIRNMRYVFLLTEPLPARRLPWPGEESPRLFENLPDRNPPREPKREERFLIFVGRNPLKSPDSEK